MNKARVYAKALFELAQEAGATGQIAEEIEIISRCLSENELYMRLLDSANIDGKERLEKIDKAFRKAHPYIINLIKMLSESMEAHIFTRCAGEYIEMYEHACGITEGRLILPREISDAALEGIRRRLNQKTGKKLRLKVDIDPSLIGGMRLEVDGRIWDNSIRARIQRISESIIGKTAEG